MLTPSAVNDRYEPIEVVYPAFAFQLPMVRASVSTDHSLNRISQSSQSVCLAKYPTPRGKFFIGALGDRTSDIECWRPVKSVFEVESKPLKHWGPAHIVHWHHYQGLPSLLNPNHGTLNEKLF